FGEEDARCIQAGQDIMQAIENVLINGPKTADIGGQAKTYEVGDAIASCVAQTKMDVFAME
ncbi:tartrate dehydrogenase, partial [Acinetobacter baumannii]